jgi:hypothetical protein
MYQSMFIHGSRQYIMSISTPPKLFRE